MYVWVTDRKEIRARWDSYCIVQTLIFCLQDTDMLSEATLNHLSESGTICLPLGRIVETSKVNAPLLLADNPG